MSKRTIKAKSDKEFKATKKDLRIMLYMAKAGGVSYESLMNRFGYSKDTITKRFTKLKYILRTPEPVVIDGKEVVRYVYSLSKSGKELMLKHNLCHHCCSYNGYEHLIKSEQELFRLVGRDDLFDSKKSISEVAPGVVALEDILCEAEQQFMHEANMELLREQGMSISAVDYLYKNDKDEYIAVEVETKNYRKERKEAHYNYVKHVLQLSKNN